LQQVRTLVGKRKREWETRTRKYKKWKQDQYGMVTDMLYASRRTAEGAEMHKPTEMDRVSDHVLISISMMGMPLIRAEMRNVFQRPIFKLHNLDAQKDNLQSVIATLLKEARLKKDGLAWLSDQISVWMEMNMEKTRPF